LVRAELQSTALVMNSPKAMVKFVILLLAIGGFLKAYSLVHAAAQTILPIAVAVPQGTQLADQIKILEARLEILEGELDYASPEIAFDGNLTHVQARILASSSDRIFAWPHSIIMIGDKMVIGTVKENPGRVAIFTDPNDLSHCLATTTSGFTNLADADYDSVHHRLYFISSRTADSRLEILSMDPDTLTWAPVFEFDAVVGAGRSTVQTDGSYVYVATQSAPAYMIKVRISDWSLQNMNVFPDGPGFHSSELYRYPDRTEWYVNTFSIPTVFYKVNVSDFSYESTTLMQSGDITNDTYFRPIDDQGGLFYIPSERGFGADVVNTATMSSTHYAAIPDSYGFFSNGADLFSTAPRDHQIIQYPNFDLTKPVIFQLSTSHIPNEWFGTSNGNTYFTDFDDPSALYQYSKAVN
jgi:hypothetical protein